MESTRTNSLNKGLETLGALITRAKSSLWNGRAHHSTNETKWQHILARNNVESSIILCFWSLFPFSPPSYLCTHIRQSPGPAQEAGRGGGHVIAGTSTPHVYLGRLDHLNCPLECSPVWKWISLWHSVLASSGERLDAVLPACVLNSKHLVD